MQDDIRLRYEQTLDDSHHGRPTVVETVRTGGCGRPRIHIDRSFLQWAYGQRSTAGISRFLNVGRNTVRRALLDFRIAESQEDPFPKQLGVTMARMTYIFLNEMTCSIPISLPLSILQIQMPTYNHQRVINTPALSCPTRDHYQCLQMTPWTS
jgi:hypothetical protein